MRVSVFVTLALLCSITKAEDVKTSEIILSLLNDPKVDEHTCRRVREFSDGAFDDASCMEALPRAKEVCGSAVNNFIGLYITSMEQARYVTRTIMFCEVWAVLGYETVTTERGVWCTGKPEGKLPCWDVRPR